MAICKHSKLVPSRWIGDRTYNTDIRFMQDLAGRMAHPIQLTSDGLEAYVDAVALNYMAYNFCRPRLTLKGRNPAMAAGVADHQWTYTDVITRVVDPN